jgi:sugar O-acyltransferase (sialic acid O-acetyltransferase NeuD family)
VKRQAIVIGAGGHCRVVLSLLALFDEKEVIGILDLQERLAGEVIMGSPVIGSTSCLETFHNRMNLDVYLAIGDNTLRRTWWEKAKGLGLTLPNLISPHAIVDSTAHLGEANVICARAFIGPKATLGSNNLINTAAILEHETRIGSHCHFAPSSTVSGRSKIGDGTFIGAGATVIDNIEVAAGIMIGAGATLVSNINENGGTYVGVPARLKRK